MDAITATTAVTIEESDTYLVVNKRVKNTTANIAKQLVNSIIAPQQKLQLLYHHGISRRLDRHVQEQPLTRTIVGEYLIRNHW